MVNVRSGRPRVGPRTRWWPRLPRMWGGCPSSGTPPLAADCCGWRRAWATGWSLRMRHARACRTQLAHLRRRVTAGQTIEASVAGGGTYALEVRLYPRFPWADLQVGNLLDTRAGDWTASAFLAHCAWLKRLRGGSFRGTSFSASSTAPRGFPAVLCALPTAARGC